MKLNTHDRTPKPDMSKTVLALFIFTAILFCLVFGLGAFACFYYAESVLAGILIIALPLVLAAVVFITMRDIARAYVVLDGDAIHTVDYFCGIKREKRFSAADITSFEIMPSSSFEIKGYRAGAGMQYIVFYNNEKYLFKIIYFPETAELLSEYMK